MWVCVCQYVCVGPQTPLLYIRPPPLPRTHLQLQQIIKARVLGTYATAGMSKCAVKVLALRENRFKQTGLNVQQSHDPNSTVPRVNVATIHVCMLWNAAALVGSRLVSQQKGSLSVIVNEDALNLYPNTKPHLTQCGRALYLQGAPAHIAGRGAG